MQPTAPNATFVTLTGTAPSWAANASLPTNKLLVYFEMDVIFHDPVFTLLPDNIVVETGKASQLSAKFSLDSSVSQAAGRGAPTYALGLQRALIRLSHVQDCLDCR